MRAQWPSLTALAVSSFRGISDDPARPGNPLDPYAERYLPRPLGRLTRTLHAVARRSTLARTGLRYGLLGLWDHLLLRTLAIDDAVTTAVAAGATQLVVLGAGLDARAARLSALSAVSVWEVDHPNTQRLKRMRAPDGAATYVGVDFGVDDLGEALAAAGHDASKPTVWIWEGVTPYLPHAAILASLAIVSGRSAPGSTLLVTYATADLAGLPQHLRPAGMWAFRALGEPLEGTVTPEVFHGWLADAGFAVQQDTDAHDWQATFLPERSPAIVVKERLVQGLKGDGQRASRSVSA